MRGSNSRGHCPADLKSAALDHSANPPIYISLKHILLHLSDNNVLNMIIVTYTTLF